MIDSYFLVLNFSYLNEQVTHFHYTALLDLLLTSPYLHFWFWVFSCIWWFAMIFDTFEISAVLRLLWGMNHHMRWFSSNGLGGHFQKAICWMQFTARMEPDGPVDTIGFVVMATYEIWIRVFIISGADVGSSGRKHFGKEIAVAVQLRWRCVCRSS